jgi:FMN-dependent NADH-azoreductase
MAKLSFILALLMGKSKTQNNIQRIEELKEKFRHLDTSVIASRLTNFNRSNSISIAYKQILKERGIDDYLSILK